MKLDPQTDTEKLQRRNRELSILNAIAEALNREVDLAQSLHTTLELVTKLFDLQTGWVWLMDEDSQQPYLAVVQNLPPALANESWRMSGTAYCHCLDTYQSGDLSGAANVNIVTCTRLRGLVEGTDGLLYHASIPLYAHGKKLGVLNVASKDWQELSENDLRLLYTVGDLIGIAIERTRLFSRSAQLGVVEERNRLAREIHDTLAQGLTAVALKLEAVDAIMESAKSIEQARKLVQQALVLTRGNLEDARRSVMDLRAASLDGRPLGDALQTLSEDYAGRANVKLTFSAGEKRSLPPHIEMGVYRITQEALSNVLRHADAQQLIVELETTPDRIELTVTDDGRGFDPNAIGEGHYGLIGMNERVRLLGGKLELCTSPGEGTTLEVVIPLKGKR